jgi:hypothetical protein
VTFKGSFWWLYEEWEGILRKDKTVSQTIVVMSALRIIFLKRANRMDVEMSQGFFWPSNARLDLPLTEKTVGETGT